MNRNLFETAFDFLNNLFDDEKVNTTIDVNQHTKIVENINKNKTYPQTQYVLINTNTQMIVNKKDNDAIIKKLALTENYIKQLENEVNSLREINANINERERLRVQKESEKFTTTLIEKQTKFVPPAIFNRDSTIDISKDVESDEFINKYLKTTRFLTEIIVHTSATRIGWDGDDNALHMFEDVHTWHVDNNGWSDVGYHFMINRIGELVIARPLSKVGAHTKDKNTHSVGIMLAGGHGGSADEKFEDHYTQEQKDTLFWLINALMKQDDYIKRLSGHNQYAAKACPCFNASEFFNVNKDLIEKKFIA
jgi:hypothetical protein